MTIPRCEAATTPPCEDDACPYTEGVRGGYRGIDRADVHFPFGHGLGYASFELVDVAATGGGDVVDVTAILKHVSGPGGAAVVQVYAAGRLRAFEKVFVEAAASWTSKPVVVELQFRGAASEVAVGFSRGGVARLLVNTPTTSPDLLAAQQVRRVGSAGSRGRRPGRPLPPG